MPPIYRGNPPKGPPNFRLPEDRVMDMFKTYDKNKDKYLSKEELKAAFQELSSKLPAYRVWRGSHYADVNGDGFISESELKDLVEYAFEIGYKVH